MEKEEAELESASGEEEFTLPKATITKMINELLPEGMVCPRATRDLLQDCCVEFIHMISSEANEACERNSKKTISPEHVIEALKSLGLDDYVDEVKAAYDEFVEESQEKTKRQKVSRKKWDESGMTAEELERQQEELFRKARDRMNSTLSSAGSSTKPVG